MGLTIHYSLKSDADSQAAARQQVEKLRQAALDLSLVEVGEVIELTGAECDPEIGKQEDEKRWLLIQARRMLQIGDGYYFATPTHVIAFSAWPGEECEVANLGLATYPDVIETKDGTLTTGMHGWYWHSFCKTQFASNPTVGGMENFVRCHLAVIRLLDAAKAIGILEEVKDEGHFWENRDVKALAETVGQWNVGLAGLAGLIKDEFPGQIIAAPITEYPNFEHLEAEGRKVGQGDLQAEEAETDLCPAAYGCPKCGERRHDWLVWNEDEVIRCQTCGHVYDPEDRPPDDARGDFG
jgi:rubredoxin